MMPGFALVLHAHVAVVVLALLSQSHSHSAHSKATPKLKGHVLEPADGAAVHCAGQSPGAFAQYTAFMGRGHSPAAFMTYVGLGNLERGWFVQLRQTLEAANNTGAFIIPQIGLDLPHGAELSRVSTPDYHPQLAELVAGLDLLGRPAYIRVGYEFNGQWVRSPNRNGQPPLPHPLHPSRSLLLTSSSSSCSVPACPHARIPACPLCVAMPMPRAKILQ